MATEVTMPQLGESVVEGTIERWLIAEGEEIQEYQPLLEVETDKVNTEIPAPASGVLLKVLVPEGSTVTVGTPLAIIGEPGEAVPGSPRDRDRTLDATPARRTEASVEVTAESRIEEGDGGQRNKPSGRRVVTPIVAKLAAEHGIDLASLDLPGSGRGGRITKKDLLAYIKRATEGPPATGEPPSPRMRGTLIPLTSKRRAIAEHMLRSVRSSPHVTTLMEVDMSRVVVQRERWREQIPRREELKPSFTPFFVQAVIEGLKTVPEANSSFTEQGILLHQQINIGIAVALDAGLIVPVIHDADKLSLSGLQRAVDDLVERARSNQLKPDEVQGGTFTITNHGVAGSLFATPIINQPQAGILGVGAIQKRPVVATVEGADSIAIKPMCYLSFTFDHRIMDGATADRFLAKVVETLNNWNL